MSSLKLAAYINPGRNAVVPTVKVELELSCKLSCVGFCWRFWRAAMALGHMSDPVRCQSRLSKQGLVFAGTPGLYLKLPGLR